MSLSRGAVGHMSMPGIPDKETLLNQTYLEAFQTNFNSVQRWTRWKEDHEEVKKVLKSLPDRLTHQAVIPFGSKALVKAKLVHTNEILTCLGDCWFVKQSAKQAEDLCDRRIKQCDKALADLEKERNLLSNRQSLPKMEEAFATDDTKEIVEEYDQEKEAEWRKQHREREREYHQKLAELRKQKREREPLQTEEDIFRRLEELELEEELNDELDRLHAEYGGEEEEDDDEEGEAYEEDNDEEGEAYEEDNDAEDEDSEDENNEEKNETDERDLRKTDLKIKDMSQPSTRSKKNNGIIREIDGKQYRKVERNESLTGKATFGFTDEEGNDWIKINEDSVQTLSPDADNSKPLIKEKRRISFADEAQRPVIESTVDSDDDEDESNNIIRFTHSDNASPVNVKELSMEALGKTSRDVPEILSPSDVYDHWKFMIGKAKPKSILKKSASLPKTADLNVESNVQESRPFGYSLGLHFSDTDEEVTEPNPTPSRQLDHLPPVLSEVKEVAQQELPNTDSGAATQRPMSRFRAARQGAKR